MANCIRPANEERLNKESNSSKYKKDLMQQVFVKLLIVNCNGIDSLFNTKRPRISIREKYSNKKLKSIKSRKIKESMKQGKDISNKLIIEGGYRSKLE